MQQQRHSIKPSHLVALVKKLEHALHQNLKSLCVENAWDLTPEQLYFVYQLYAIVDTERLQVTKLARTAVFLQTNNAHTIQKLTGLGLLRVFVSPLDIRCKEVQLTEAGAEIARTTNAALQKQDSKFDGDLSSHLVDTLHRVSVYWLGEARHI